MHFSDKIKIKYNKKDNQVSLSIKLTDTVVVVTKMSVDEFKHISSVVLSEIEENGND
ncbi:MAG: hypothetical protein WC284_10915 [Candidimonas sp.]